MPKKTSTTGSELFIVDNSDQDWKVLRYLHDWCQISKAFDIATGFFEIGALLGLNDEWQKVDQIRILMGSQRTEKYSSADFLANSGIPTKIDSAHAIAHNKVMIIDGETVITGSFNFTKGAEEKNSENLLVIHDKGLAARYIDNWKVHASHSENYAGRK